MLNSLAGGTMMKSTLPLAVVCFSLLTATLVTLQAGAVCAQGSADVSLEQQVQGALANAGFDPGPADGDFGPKTRRAIQAWQRANGHAETGYLTRDQLRSILAEAKRKTAQCLERAQANAESPTAFRPAVVIEQGNEARYEQKLVACKAAASCQAQEADGNAWRDDLLECLRLASRGGMLWQVLE